MPPLGSPLPLGPSLAKASKQGGLDRRGRVVVRRGVSLVRLRPSYVARLLSTGDIVSEGRCVDEPDRRMYFGSTSVRLELEAVTGCLEGEPLAGTTLEAAELGAVLAHDPHARLFAVRLARREAGARAGGQLEAMYAELTVRVLIEGAVVRLALDIDVSAAVARGVRSA